MSDRIFFFVFKRNGRNQYAVFHGDLPTASATAACGAVIFRQELKGAWAGTALKALGAEFERLAAAGTLPADNTIAKAKPQARRIGVLIDTEIPESAVTFAARRRAALA